MISAMRSASLIAGRCGRPALVGADPVRRDARPPDGDHDDLGASRARSISPVPLEDEDFVGLGARVGDTT
jgi:hypothetical protein